MYLKFWVKTAHSIKFLIHSVLKKIESFKFYLYTQQHGNFYEDYISQLSTFLLKPPKYNAITCLMVIHEIKPTAASMIGRYQMKKKSFLFLNNIFCTFLLVIFYLRKEKMFYLFNFEISLYTDIIS